ncbi:MAG: M48 family metallopeptidase [Myxococcota bacterium]
MKRRRRIQVLLLPAVLLAACVTSPLGRKQLHLFSESKMDEMGAAAYAELQWETPHSQDAVANAYVRCVTDAVVDALADGDRRYEWEVTVFRGEAVNAFALPGGKIGVYTGLLEVARGQHQLAAVIGHEVGHVLASHGNERISQSVAIQTGLGLGQVIAGAGSSASPELFALLGLGAQVGILLPFSRIQESEADWIGLDLMARAGFDPRASVSLWQNMARAGGSAPPELLSTHPSSDTRIQDLQRRMTKAVLIQEAARARGNDPHCS